MSRITATNKPVTRVSTFTYSSRLGLTGHTFGKQRRIVVTIGPGDTLTLRWHKTRQLVYVALDNIMRRAQRDAQQLALMSTAPKRKGKKREQQLLLPIDERKRKRARAVPRGTV
jgi:hypothetical protein